MIDQLKDIDAYTESTKLGWVWDDIYRSLGNNAKYSTLRKKKILILFCEY